MKSAHLGDLLIVAGHAQPEGGGWTFAPDGPAWWRLVEQSGPVADDVMVLHADPLDLELRAQDVRDAWARASEADDYPQGFGWPGDLYDALEAL